MQISSCCSNIQERRNPQTPITIVQSPYPASAVKFLSLSLRIIYYPTLICHDLITPSHYGFLQKHSTTTNLMESLNNWTLSLEQKPPVRILYIDFDKAFDKVSIPKLFHKPKHLGITGLLLQCIESFLTNRTHAVRIDGVQSRFLDVVSVASPRAASLALSSFYFFERFAYYFDPSFSRLAQILRNVSGKSVQGIFEEKLVNKFSLMIFGR